MIKLLYCSKSEPAFDAKMHGETRLLLELMITAKKHFKGRSYNVCPIEVIFHRILYGIEETPVEPCERSLKRRNVMHKNRIKTKKRG